MGSAELTWAGRRWRHRRRDTFSDPVEAVRAGAHFVLFTLVCMVAASVLPVIFGWRPYVVLSGSMTPLIGVGDVVVAAPASSGGITPGRVIVFPEPGTKRLMVHRVHSRAADGTLTTKGDVNNAVDSSPLPAGDVRGVARIRLPMIGLPLYWYQNREWAPLGAVAALLLTLVAMCYWRPNRRHLPDAARAGRHQPNRPIDAGPTAGPWRGHAPTPRFPVRVTQRPRRNRTDEDGVPRAPVATPAGHRWNRRRPGGHSRGILRERRGAGR